jgi:hypothetical protein
LVSRVEPWGFFIVIALVIAGIVDTWWMRPVMEVTKNLLNLFLKPLASLFY